MLKSYFLIVDPGMRVDSIILQVNIENVILDGEEACATKQSVDKDLSSK